MDAISVTLFMREQLSHEAAEGKERFDQVFTFSSSNNRV